MEVKRLYIGGLYPEVTEADLKDRFSKFGAVDNVEIKVREQMEGMPVKTFAYLNLTAEEPDIKRCVKTFDKTKWKGSELKIQMAKENFLSRLIKERALPEEKEKSHEGQKTSPAKVFEMEIKGPPGTKVPGEENWVVGKYGRVLPVVNIKKEGSRHVKKIDPSKFVHNVKKLDKDNSLLTDDRIKPEDLTWQLDFNENEVTKKRKGEFTDFKPKQKHRKSSQFDSLQSSYSLNEHRTYNNNYTKNSVNVDDSFKSNNADEFLKSGRKHKKLSNSTASYSNEIDIDEIIQKTSPTNKASRDNYDSSGDSDSWQNKHLANSSHIDKLNTSQQLAMSDDTGFEVVDPDRDISKMKTKPKNDNLDLKRFDSDGSDDDTNKSLSFIQNQNNKKGIVQQRHKNTNISKREPSVKKSPVTLEHFKGTRMLQESIDTKINSKDIGNNTNEFDKNKTSERSKRFEKKSGEVQEVNKSKNTNVNSSMFDTLNEFSSGFSSYNKPADPKSSSSDSESDEDSDIEDSSKMEVKHESDKPMVHDSSSSESESGEENSKEKETVSNMKAKSTVHKNSAHNKPDAHESSSSEDESSEESGQEKDVNINMSEQILQNPLAEQDSSSDNEDNVKNPIYKKMNEQSDSSVSDSSEDEIASKKLSTSVEPEIISYSKHKPINESEKSTIVGKLKDEKIGKSKLLQTKVLTNCDSPKQSSPQKSIKQTEISKASESKTRSKTENKVSVDDREKTSESRTDNKVEAGQKTKSHAVNTEEVEQRRLAAVKQKFKQNLKQLATVQHALSNTNQGYQLNKKVVFDDDSEDEGYQTNVKMTHTTKQEYTKNDDDDSDEDSDENDDNEDNSGNNDETDQPEKIKTSQMQVSQSDSSSSSYDESDDDDDDDESDDKKDDVHKSRGQIDKQTEKKKLTLFDNSSSSSESDDDDDDDDDDRFAVRPQFEGSSGAKLLELQASYGNDKRFYLDERFAESDSDDDKHQGDGDNIDEKQNALKILESVVGFKVTTEKTDKKQSNFKDISSLHYDPTREEHKEFELTKDHKSTKKSKKSEDTPDSTKDSPEDDEASKKMQERFFEVSDTFKKTLTTESSTEGGQTFSLLQAFGAKGSDVEEEEDGNKDTEESPGYKLPLDVRFLRRPDKDFDTEDKDEIEMDIDDNSPMINKSSKPTKGKKDKRTFFFFFKDEDERMKATTQFYRTEDLDVIREQWKKEKEAHIQRFKLKAKNFSRKKTQPGHAKHGDIFERRKIDQRLKRLHSRKK